MDCQAPNDDVVIIAPRLPEAPGEAAYSAYELDPLLIERATRLDEALRTAPGVATFRRNSSAAANPTIQGLSVRASAPSGAGRALVTLNGQPMNDPFGGWVIWGALIPETIARATILRGAGAGPYGAGALTGVVSLEEQRALGMTASGEIGDRGYARASARGEMQAGAWAMVLAGAAQQHDGWTPLRDRAGAADTDIWSDSLSGAARAEYRGGEHILSFRVSGYSENRGAGLIGAASESQGANAAITLASPRGALAWRLQAWAMASDLYNTSVAVSPDRSTTTPANEQYETPALGWGGNAAIRWTHDDHGVEIGADVRAADGETRERFAFSGGAYTRDRVAGGRALTAGLYAEGWRETGAWTFTGGVRADVNRAEDGSRVERLIATGATVLNVRADDSETTAPTARFGVRHAHGAFYTRGAAYAGFRPPTLNELHRPFRVGNDVTEANPSLEPERLAGADAGIGAAYANWKWDAGIFATRLEDAIVNVTLGAGPGTFPPGVFVPAGGAYRQRQNAGTIDAIGLEAQADGALTDTLIWRGALNYTDAAFSGGALDGLRPAQSPEWSASFGFDWRARETTTISAAVTHEGARFEDDLNSRRLSAATVLDLRVEHGIGRGLFVYAALDNALGAAMETAESADGVESFGPPRAMRVGLRLRR